MLDSEPPVENIAVLRIGTERFCAPSEDRLGRGLLLSTLLSQMGEGRDRGISTPPTGSPLSTSTLLWAPLEGTYVREG